MLLYLGDYRTIVFTFGQELALLELPAQAINPQHLIEKTVHTPRVVHKEQHMKNVVWGVHMGSGPMLDN